MEPSPKLTHGWDAPSLTGAFSIKVAIVISAVALLAASAHIKMPFWPVPMTLQTLVVLLIGYFLGFRLAMTTMAIYLIGGAAGLPMFAGTPEKGLGLAYMAGPTGGYLVGFVVATAISSQIRNIQGAFSIVTIPLGFIAASIAIHAFGFAWLSQFVGLDGAWRLGVLPFVLSDLVKVGLATTICYLFAGRLRRV